MVMAVGHEVVAALAGVPEVGTWEPMFSLLTVDEAGFPHVCLLSRAELHADARHVYAALATRTTVVNLERRPTATLVVLTDDAAHYLKLRAVSMAGSPLTGVVFEVITSARDSLGIPLAPPRYLVTSSLPVAESWAESAKLLRVLAGHEPGPGGEPGDEPGRQDPA